VAAVHIFGLLESDDQSGAAAVAVVLLTLALVLLLLLQAIERWRTRHER
jgi:sulfate transport system permease protein